MMAPFRCSAPQGVEIKMNQINRTRGDTNGFNEGRLGNASWKRHYPVGR